MAVSSSQITELATFARIWAPPSTTQNMYAAVNMRVQADSQQSKISLYRFQNRLIVFFVQMVRLYTYKER